MQLVSCPNLSAFIADKPSPCDDPYKSAIGFPPEPPAVREVPRELPGWPCAFQPPGTDCDDGSVSRFVKREPSETKALPRDHKSENLVLSARAKGHDKYGDQKGLPDRDLLYPEYAIHNKAAFKDSWNAEQGGISNKTVLTNVISQNGIAQYDVSQ